MSNEKFRFVKHGDFLYTREVSRSKPWKIVYYQAFESKEDCIREEQFLKTGKGRERVNYLLEFTLEKYRRGG